MDKRKYISELNESIKDYNEEILINRNEYREPYEIITKDGKDTVEKGRFLEINKSNELFKKGKKAVGTIIDILDKREFNILSDTLDGFEGDVFLIVKFENDQGQSYTIKTPAIISSIQSGFSSFMKLLIP